MESIALTILIVGIVMVLGLFAKLMLPRILIHPIIGYIIIGILLKLIDLSIPILSDELMQPLGFLAEVGVIILLFRAGMESNIRSLIAQLPLAIKIWLWNVVISGGLGFLSAFYWLELSLVASLFAAIALSATSITVSLAILKSLELQNTKLGQLLLDVAELDDLSSIMLLAILLAITPILIESQSLIDYSTVIINNIAIFFLVLIVFIVGCSVFSWKIEPVLSRWVALRQKEHEHLLMIFAAGLIIASLAEWVGLSLAIGAFFAGLAFSRDPETAKERICFQPLYEFFTPFFFIGIGLHIQPDVFAEAFYPGAILLVTAIIGKVIGAGLPALTHIGLAGAATVGLSMVPRAEIAMVIIKKGFDFGHDVIPQQLFSAMIIVVAGTTLLTAIVLPLLSKYLPKHIN